MELFARHKNITKLVFRPDQKVLLLFSYQLSVKKKEESRNYDVHTKLISTSFTVHRITASTVRNRKTYSSFLTTEPFT